MTNAMGGPTSASRRAIDRPVASATKRAKTAASVNDSVSTKVAAAVADASSCDAAREKPKRTQPKGPSALRATTPPSRKRNAIEARFRRVTRRAHRSADAAAIASAPNAKATPARAWLWVVARSNRPKRDNSTSNEVSQSATP